MTSTTRPVAGGAGAERARDDAVDAVGAAIGRQRSAASARREERVEVAHGHAVAGEEQRAVGQQAAELGEDLALEQLGRSPTVRVDRVGARAD